MTFKAKADAPRPMELFVERRTAPNTISGLWAKLSVMSTWRNYRFEFVSKDDMPRTNLVISLMKDDTPFEIAELKFEASPPTKPGAFHVLAFPKGSGHGAVARPREDDPTVLRVDQISTFERVPWHVQLARNPRHPQFRKAKHLSL